MWYAIISEDVQNSLPLRAKSRAAHLDRMKALVNEGRVLVAGAHPAIDAEDPGPAGFSGGLVVIDFPSRQDAKEWAAADPYAAAGVYANVIVKPFKRVLP